MELNSNGEVISCEMCTSPEIIDIPIEGNQIQRLCYDCQHLEFFKIPDNPPYDPNKKKITDQDMIDLGFTQLELDQVREELKVERESLTKHRLLLK